MSCPEIIEIPGFLAFSFAFLCVICGVALLMELMERLHDRHPAPKLEGVESWDHG